MTFIETFPVGLLQCNCTILASEETGEALVIDPGDEVERILEALRKRNLTCTAILHTHAHIDHLGATAPLARATGARVLLHRDDLPLYEHAPEQAAMFGFNPPPFAPVDRYVKDGESLRIGRVEAELLHTPGHSPGSLCLHLPGAGAGKREDADPTGAGTGDSQRGAPDTAGAETADTRPRLFAGDTLFAGSIGRTDLWGGDQEAILRSIHRRLLVLPDETVVVPGHGEMTTIGIERRRNPFLVG